LLELSARAALREALIPARTHCLGHIIKGGESLSYREALAAFDYYSEAMHIRLLSVIAVTFGTAASSSVDARLCLRFEDVSVSF